MSVDVIKPKKPFLPKRAKKAEPVAPVAKKSTRSVPAIAGGFAMVDLLPVEVKAVRQSLVIGRLAGTGFAAVVVVVGGAYLLASANALAAQTELATASSKTIVLQSQQGRFLDGRTTATTILTLESARSYAASTDVDLQKEIDPILARLPEGSVVKSVNATFPAAWEPALAPADELRGERVGNITFTIDSPDVAGISAWARSLRSETGYADSTIDSSEMKDGLYETVVTFNIDADVRSNRFAADTGE